MKDHGKDNKTCLLSTVKTGWGGLANTELSVFMAQTALVGQIAQESILICCIVIKGQVTAGFKWHGSHTLYHVTSWIVETSPLRTLGVKWHTETRVRSQRWQW